MFPLLLPRGGSPAQLLGAGFFLALLFFSTGGFHDVVDAQVRVLLMTIFCAAMLRG